MHYALLIQEDEKLWENYSEAEQKGLKTEEVAKAFLISNETMSQRLWRANEKMSEQDRGSWHHREIDEGSRLTKEIFQAGFGNTRYALMSAIASIHANSPDAGSTNCVEICRLYEFLREFDSSPVIVLNHAVAMGERDGAEAGLVEVEKLAGLTTMQRYYLYHSTRAEFFAGSEE